MSSHACHEDCPDRHLNQPVEHQDGWRTTQERFCSSQCWAETRSTNRSIERIQVSVGT
ncbi:hypothetical protein [Mesorhizobium sp. M0092]|uniref:hypothetical protein n=1 Tax=Mesorhizobium sp. M0092 TaxID=2956876 RepID=UPI0033376673